MFRSLFVPRAELVQLLRSPPITPWLYLARRGGTNSWSFDCPRLYPQDAVHPYNFCLSDREKGNRAEGRKSRTVATSPTVPQSIYCDGGPIAECGGDVQRIEHAAAGRADDAAAVSIAADVDIRAAVAEIDPTAGRALFCPPSEAISPRARESGIPANDTT